MKKRTLHALLIGLAMVSSVIYFFLATAGHDLNSRMEINFRNIRNYLDINSNALEFLYNEHENSGSHDGKWLADKLLMDPSGEGYALLNFSCWSPNGAKDLWGRLLHYEFNNLQDLKINFKLWSDGKNGINEFGDGDDIALSYTFEQSM